MIILSYAAAVVGFVGAVLYFGFILLLRFIGKGEAP
jgi:hypothetical protein